MRQKLSLILADSFTEKELRPIIHQDAGQDWVSELRKTVEDGFTLSSNFQPILVDLSSSLVLFNTIQQGDQICRTPRWWKSGDLEKKKSG